MKRCEIIEHLRFTPLTELMARADAVRGAAVGDAVYVRGIIEFSNNCARNCFYCGLRRANRELVRYRMTPADIMGAVGLLVRNGIYTVVLQSGDDFAWTRDALCRLIQSIKAAHPGLAVTLSVGERPLDDYRAFRESGADRYLLKHETISAALYRRLHPGQNLAHRLAILERLKTLGYQVGTGFIVGLPGQTPEILARDILFLQSFQPEMAGIGPFLPQANTPLAGHPPGNLEVVLRVLALARLAAPRAHLPATTALATLAPERGYIEGLRAGCNVIMLNATPERFKRDYRIYDHRERFNLTAIKRFIKLAARRYSGARGDALPL